MTGTRDCCRRERIGYAIYTALREPKLYKMAVNGSWDQIPSRCKSHPKEAKYVHKYGSMDTALHRILRAAVGGGEMLASEELDVETRRALDEVKLQAVSALLETNRQAAATPDAFGRTPLHLACMDVETCGEASVYMIVDAHPQAALLCDNEGRTPLHYLVARNDTIPSSLLAKIIAIYPQALDVPDLVKETPLDIAEARKDEIEDVETVIRILKTGTQFRSERSSTFGGKADLAVIAPQESARRVVSNAV